MGAGKGKKEFSGGFEKFKSKKKGDKRRDKDNKPRRGGK